MLFNSFIFWGFFAATLIAYYPMPHRTQNRILLLASYVFYGYWDWRFLSLILLSKIIDFYVARRIVSSPQESAKKRWLSLSLVSNLGLLGVFKYYDFFAEELNTALVGIGLNDYLPLLAIVLPVGISFYTFQTISYSVDVYKGKTRPAENFFDFALYVSFFPQLVAGPIERSHQLLPQVEKPRHVTKANLTEGAYLIVFGLFKKVVIADNMATLVNHVFNSPTDALSGGEVLLGLYAFAFQIYGDFSGYSSIAQGLAKMLGFELMWNFRMPYFSVSPSDFWKRWHISLSSWIRDYLYIPLGGSRHGTVRTTRNLCVTMLLAGLWHGAAWTYVVWGGFHGVLMVVYRAFAWLGGDDDQAASGTGLGRKGLRVLRAILFFHLVCIGWLFFRANSMEQAWDMLAILSSTWLSSNFLWYGAALFAFFVTPFLLYELWLEKKGDQLALLQEPWPVQAACYSYVSVLSLVFVPIAPAVFIYFQF